MNLIGWSMVTTLKEEGGLGIRDLRLVRKTHCAKQLIPLLNSEDLHWVKVLKSKYDPLTPWGHNRIQRSSWNWRNLSICWELSRWGSRGA